MLFHGGHGLTDEGVGGGVALPAPLAAAGARLAVVDDDDMPALAAAAVDAGEDLPVQNDACADTGAQGDEDQALHVLVLKVVVLPQSGAVGVVAQVDRDIPVLVEHLRHGHEADGDVHGLDDHALFVVHRPGEAHAHAGDLLPGHAVLLQKVQGHLHQGLPHLLHGHESQGRLLGGHDLVALVHQPRLQVGPADVDSNVVHD